MNKKKVYIIVLNWNGTQDTIECLESLKKLTYQNYQIILVDNGSDDTSFNELNKWCINNFQNVQHYDKEIAEKGGSNETEFLLEKSDSKERLLIIKNNENLGFAAGNNVALRYFLSKKEQSYSLLLNNDTIVESNFLNELVIFMDNNTQYVACTPKIMLNGNRDLSWNCGGEITWFGNRRYYHANEIKSKIPQTGFNTIQYITGCALFFKPQYTGILSEKFFFGEEDFEFSLRMKKEKKKMACVYESVIYHKVGGTISNSAKNILNKAFLHYVSRLIDHKSHYKSPVLEIIRVINLAYGILLIAYKYKKGIRKGLKFAIKVYKYVKKNNSVSKDKFIHILNNQI